jgi:hypothetical protein
MGMLGLERSSPTQMLSNNQSKAGQTTDADQSITNNNLLPQPALREPSPMISPGSDPPELGEAARRIVRPALIHEPANRAPHEHIQECSEKK